MSLPDECLVMAKPVGPRCNLSCGYCYYLGNESLHGDESGGEPSGCMPEDILFRYISQRLDASPGPNTHFEWHGGEPTLAGVNFYHTAVRMQNELLPEGRTVTNGLQTNGVLIDEEWALFLLDNGFSVGLSIDGPAGLHDTLRKTIQGSGSHSRAANAFGLLKEKGVFCNVLCVLHRGNTAEPDLLYDYFRGLGVTYLQFLPFVPVGPTAGARAAAAAPEEIGSFLIRVFDRWIQEDVGRVVIQAFDEALRPVYGVPHALCVHRETCGDVAVLERNGDFFTCDHFVDPGHLIGNIREKPIAELAADPGMTEFGRMKRSALPDACRTCDVLTFCNGGCPKDRLAVSSDGEPGLNYLCSGYKPFFRHVRPALIRLAAHMKAGRSLRSFKA